MPWSDRIGEGAYTSPSGERIVFQVEDVEKELPRKTSKVSFVGANASYVHDDGTDGRIYPMVIYFSGDSHDIEADRFENALVELGVGVLDHPLYGRKDVQIVGSASRSDRLTTAGNQTVVSLTFQETIRTLWPAAAEVTSAAIDVATESLREAAVADLAAVDIERPAERAGFLARVKALAAGVKNAFNKIGGGLDAVQERMDQVSNAINASIDLGIATPLTLARQLEILIGEPARIRGQVLARLDAYANLAASIAAGLGAGGGGGGINSLSRASGDLGVVPLTGGIEALNIFVLNRAVAAFAISSFAAVVRDSSPSSAGVGTGSGVSLVVLDDAIDTVDRAQDVIDSMRETTDATVAWSDTNTSAILQGATAPGAEVDEVEGLEGGAVEFAIATTNQAVRAHLLAVAVGLGRVRYHVTPARTHALQLAATLYGDLAAVNRLIADNKWGNQIIEVPAGERVRYYAP